MLVAAAVCPETPLLVPELASGAAGETRELREAASAAARALLSTDPEVLVVAAGTPGKRSGRAAFGGSFRPYGVDLVVGAEELASAELAQPAADDEWVEANGPGLAVARWLVDTVRIDTAHADLAVEAWAVGADADPADCAALGARFAAADRRIALLVMGDGSARRGEKAPGYVDERAVPFDEGVGAALAGADAAALAGVDPELAARLMVAGRAAWQVLAGAVRADARRWSGELLHFCAPYGVGYFAAAWAPAG